MKQTMLLLLGIMLSSQVAFAGKYVIDQEGDGGPEAYLEVGEKQNLVIVACSASEGKYDFEIAVPINNPAAGSMLETMQKDTESSIKGTACAGDFCKQLTFDHSDYFDGPTTRASFDSNQISSAASLEVKLPGDVDLKWDGQVRDVLKKTCR